MGLLYSMLWLPLILTIQLVAILSTLVFCSKKKKPAEPIAPAPAAAPAPAPAAGAPPQLAPLDKTQDLTMDADKKKERTVDGATTVKFADEPDLNTKPLSVVVPTGNDKLINKGNGIVVDKDGKPISQLAKPL